MSILKQTIQQPEEQFIRDVGISKQTFFALLEKVEEALSAEKEKNPMKKRGRKQGVSWAEKLLLTLTYLRHYPTFAKLGKEFGISESYANKIYHQILELLVKVLPKKSKKELMSGHLGTVLIDVTEQPIERPFNRQRDYYSGKKKVIRSKSSSLSVGSRYKSYR